MDYEAQISEFQLNELSQAIKAMGILSFSFPQAGIFDAWIESEWFEIQSFIFKTKPSKSGFHVYQLIIEKGDDASVGFNNRFLNETWWVEKVELFEKRVNEYKPYPEVQELWFDYAIVFTMYLGENKKRLCISPKHSGWHPAATLDSEAIDAIINNCRIRWSA